MGRPSSRLAPEGKPTLPEGAMSSGWRAVLAPPLARVGDMLFGAMWLSGEMIGPHGRWSDRPRRRPTQPQELACVIGRQMTRSS
jgi:hypothetical protein